jgi:cytochrome c oxidase subunit 1
VLVFINNEIVSLRKKETAGPDPCDALTLERSIPSPPPHYNFKEIPQVRGLDEWWHRKYVEDARGMPVPVPQGGAVAVGDHDDDEFDEHSIHMPNPSFMPLIAAVGLPIIAFGLLYSYPLVAVGAVIMIVGLYGWVLEPASD